MKLNPKDLDPLKREAVKIIRFIGRACGLKHKEIDDLVWRIENRTEEFIKDYNDYKIARNPFRIVLLAFVDQRKSMVFPWYKPWIERRMLNIQRNYVNWWEQFDPETSVAQAFESSPVPA